MDTVTILGPAEGKGMMFLVLQDSNGQDFTPLFPTDEAAWKAIQGTDWRRSTHDARFVYSLLGILKLRGILYLPNGGTLELLP